MGVLDGKSAIVTGSARGIGRATAELLASQGAQVLINDLDGDVAEQASQEISGETAVFSGDLTEGRRGREARAERDRRVREDRHHRQQRRLHDRRADPQDVRRAVPGDARHPPDRAVQGDPRRRAAPARARQEGARGRQRGVPQDRQHLLDLGHDGQRRAGQLLLRQGGRHRPHQDARQGVGPVQGQRQRGRLRLHRHAPDGRQGGGEHDGDRRREGAARHPRADARDGLDADPARTPRHSPRRPPAASSSCARRGPTTCTARSSTSPAASSSG